MLTFEQAAVLEYGDILVDNNNKRWKVNGKVQRWKRSPERIRVPLKHGLYRYGAITESDFDSDGECDWLTWERLVRSVRR